MTHRDVNRTELKTHRVVGLDAVRAVCATWVVMGHFGGPPLTDGLDESHPVARIVGGVFNNFWNGPAAVIVFFVVSGFCIHYPYARTLKIPVLSSYAVRRYLRVGIPLVFAMPLAWVLGVNLSLFNQSILWSLVAELVYYTLFPVLLWLRSKAGNWRPIIATATVAALVLASTNATAGNYPSFGNRWNWLLGLPCWLCGCYLAEIVDRRSGDLDVSPGSIWRWRMAIFLASVCCSVLRFHTPIGYPWTLNGFAVLATAWLHREIEWFSRNPPPRWLEWVGVWSYSIYLGHVLALPMLRRLEVPNLGVGLNWLCMMVFVFAFSYVFYLFVEYPGHVAARAAGRVLMPDIKQA